MTQTPSPALRIDRTTVISSPPAAGAAAQQPALTVFALGMIGLGAMALVVGDFALGWQPVAPWVPGRTALAYGSGILMLVSGAGLLFRSTVKWSVRVLFPYCVLWALLHAPALIESPTVEGAWLSFGEIAVLLAGAWTLFARLGGLGASPISGWLEGESGVRIARYWFAVWLIPIGLSHFVYIKETHALVPAWLPDRTGWGYLTGAGQIASGLGVLFKLFPRVAGWAEAVQIFLYTLLIWLPAVLFGPSKDMSSVFANADRRLCWTAFWISWAIGAGAWVVAQNVPAKRRAKPDA
jgi:uncharacterized membrane protein